VLACARPLVPSPSLFIDLDTGREWDLRLDTSRRLEGVSKPWQLIKSETWVYSHIRVLVLECIRVVLRRGGEKLG
jgi:hypothetical protein